MILSPSACQVQAPSAGSCAARASAAVRVAVGVAVGKGVGVMVAVAVAVAAGVNVTVGNAVAVTSPPSPLLVGEGRRGAVEGAQAERQTRTTDKKKNFRNTIPLCKRSEQSACLTKSLLQDRSR